MRINKTGEIVKKKKKKKKQLKGKNIKRVIYQKQKLAQKIGSDNNDPQDTELNKMRKLKNRSKG